MHIAQHSKAEVFLRTFSLPLCNRRGLAFTYSEKNQLGAGVLYVLLINLN